MNAAPIISHRPAPQALAGEIHADDSCVYELISAPWEIMATPRDGRAFAHRKSYLVTPSAILYQECFDSCVRVQGLTPAGMLGFSVPIHLGGRSAFWNNPLQAASLPASLPGALDSVIDAGQVHIIVLLNLDFVRATLPDDFVARLESTLRTRALPALPGAVNRMARWLQEVLEAACRRPKTFRQAAAIRAFEEELLARLIDLARLPTPNRIRPTLSCRVHGFARAIEFLRDSDLSTLTVPELCRVANVSQRSLEYAFRDAFGLSPLGYLRLQRFHHVRRALLEARQNEVSVADIAHRAGFYELGRFAGTYRRLFGELPSVTLGHPAPNTRWLRVVSR